jgi:hypothetical protein
MLPAEPEPSDTEARIQTKDKTQIYKARQDKARQDKARQGKARQDKRRHDKTQQEENTENKRGKKEVKKRGH